ADKPRYIETIPRIGYRFIAPVIPPANSTAASTKESDLQPAADLPDQPAIAASKPTLNSRRRFGAFAFAAIAVLVSLFYWATASRRPTHQTPAQLRSIAV